MVKTYTYSHITKTFILATETNIVTVLGYHSSGCHNSSRISAYFLKMIFTTGSSSVTSLSPPTLIVLLLSVRVEAFQLCLLIFSHFIWFSVFLDSLALLYLLYPSKRKIKRKFPLMFFKMDAFHQGCVYPPFTVSSHHLL